MKVVTILRAINTHAAIYVCLAAFFAACWFFHYVAFIRMEACNRQFYVMNDETIRSMTLIDFVATNDWLFVVYPPLVVTTIVFLQLRRQPPWIWWLAAVVLCIPCCVYWTHCAYISLKF